MTACETCGNTLTRDTMGGDEPYLQGAIEHCEHCDGDDEPRCEACGCTRWDGVKMTSDKGGDWYCDDCLPAAIGSHPEWFDAEPETREAKNGQLRN